jgi:elongation factor G
MDRTGANFYCCVDTIIEMLGATIIPAILQLPIGTEGDILGVIDLVTMEAIPLHSVSSAHCPNQVL